MLVPVPSTRDRTIALRVANGTIEAARERWRENDGSVPKLRAAYRACVLAARSARTAAKVWEPVEKRVRRKMAEHAERLEAAAAELLEKLSARAVAGVLGGLEEELTMDRADEYDPNQPRDPDGRWGSGGFGGAGAAKASGRKAGSAAGASKSKPVDEPAKPAPAPDPGGFDISPSEQAFVEAQKKKAAEKRAAKAAAAAEEKRAAEAKAAKAAEEAKAAEKPKTAKEERAAKESARVAELAKEHVPQANREYGEKKITERQVFNAKSTSVTEKVVLDDGSTALFKPSDGERSGLRTNIRGGTYYQREAAASNVADILGVRDMVPRVAVHEESVKQRPRSPGDGWGDLPDEGPATHSRVGALQEWREGKPLAGMPKHVTYERDHAERMRVFDYVTGNSDRHSGNVLVDDRSGKTLPVAIDHGLAFPSGKPDRFIQPMDAIPHVRGLLPSTHEQIKNIDVKKLATMMRASSIDREAAHHAVARALKLKANPEILAVPEEVVTMSDHAKSRSKQYQQFKDYTWDSVAQSGTDDHVDEAYAIVDEAYRK